MDGSLAGWTMLFLTRTAICIGLVAFAASNASGGGLGTALDRSVRDAAETAGRACLGSGDCVRIGATMLAAAAPLSAAAQDGRGVDAAVGASVTVARTHRRPEPAAARAALPSPASPRVSPSPSVSVSPRAGRPPPPRTAGGDAPSRRV